jgi:hypothetical protein
VMITQKADALYSRLLTNITKLTNAPHKQCGAL